MASNKRDEFQDPFKAGAAFLARYREGHEVTLDRVYRSFERPLRNFLLRGFAFKSSGRQLFFSGIQYEHDLQDILQETFRRAFGPKARQSYDGIRPFKNYLFTIARNAVITDLTHRRRQIPVGEAILADGPSEEMSGLESWVASRRPLYSEIPAPSCEDRAEHLEVFAITASFMETLDDVECLFFRTRFLGGCSQERTARKMGWNRARVRKWEARLRRAFLAHNQGSGYLEMRSECRKVRRADNPEQHTERWQRGRAIFRKGRIEQEHEILWQAA